MFVQNLSETILLGQKFAKQLPQKSIILLQGPIGAGKTSFVQGIAKGLFIKESITSPTFSLSHHYDSGLIPLIHMDLYRLNNSISAKELFLEEEEELNSNQGIIVVEWPEFIIPIIESYWLVEIKYAKEYGRNFKIYKPKELNDSLTFS